MRTQTKCTLGLLGMFIIEIFPLPFTALYSLYVVRKRPHWLPGMVDSLYADKPGYQGPPIEQLNAGGTDPISTRRKCTLTLASMLTVDIIVPFTIPFGLYIVRRRPVWFKNVVARLYSDKLQGNALASDMADEAEEQVTELMEKKLIELECSNVDYVQSLGKNGK